MQMVTTEPVGLRERKKAEARAAIIEAALQLYRERGFDAVTIDQIAERAGVARRTYFRYFETKEAVVIDRRLKQLEKFRALIEGAPPSLGGVDVLREAMKTMAADFNKGKRRILAERALFASSRHLAARDVQVDREFEDVIAEAVMKRSAKNAVAQRGARLYAAAAMGVLRVLLDEWAASDGEVDLIKLGNPAIDAIAGLAPPHKPPR